MQKRNAVEHVVSMGQSSRSRAYRIVGLARSNAYYRGQERAERLRKEGLIEEASPANPVWSRINVSPQGFHLLRGRFLMA